MFTSKYQGSPVLGVLTLKGSNPAKSQGWRATGKVSKEFSKRVRGYVYRIDGGHATALSVPRSSSAKLGIRQPVLVLQLCIPQGKHCAFEVGVSDVDGVKHRLAFSTAFRGPVAVRALHVQVPIRTLVPQ